MCTKDLTPLKFCQTYIVEAKYNRKHKTGRNEERAKNAEFCRYLQVIARSLLLCDYAKQTDLG